MMHSEAPSSERGYRIAHGVLFLALFVLLYLTPPIRHWPWFWIDPLAGYVLVVTSLRPLRRTFNRPCVRRINLATCALTAAIILLSSSILLLSQFFMHPDVAALGAMMPVHALGGVILTGVVFALVNAVCEEIIFRGILFDALEAERGWQGAVYATAFLFALGHWNGYPPGWGGAILAGIYGITLGLLRVHTGGLLLPIVAPHRCGRDDLWDTCSCGGSLEPRSPFEPEFPRAVRPFSGHLSLLFSRSLMADAHPASPIPKNRK